MRPIVSGCPKRSGSLPGFAGERTEPEKAWQPKGTKAVTKIIYYAQAKRADGQHLYEVEAQRRVTQRSTFSIWADTPEEARERLVRKLQTDWYEPFLAWDIHLNDIYDHEHLYAQVTCEEDDGRVEREIDLSEFDDEIKSEPANLPKLADGTYRIVDGVIETRVDTPAEVSGT